MAKDIIGFNGIEYQLSTVCLEDYGIYETMIFPIERGVVLGEEVYKFRTSNLQESEKKHTDAYYHPEKYLTMEAINKYLKSKEKEFMDNEVKFKEEDFTKDELMLLRLAFKLVGDVVEMQRTSNSDVYLCNELYSLTEKLGINELLD